MSGKIKPRELKIEEVEFELTVEEEDMPVRGNAMASGDDAADKEVEDEIIERLERGDIYAWFQAKMTAKWEGFTGVDYLGGCSYTSEKDFMEPGGYYDDMKNQALYDLNKKIKEKAEKLQALL